MKSDSRFNGLSLPVIMSINSSIDSVLISTLENILANSETVPSLILLSLSNTSCAINLVSFPSSGERRSSSSSKKSCIMSAREFVSSERLSSGLRLNLSIALSRFLAE